MRHLRIGAAALLAAAALGTTACDERLSDVTGPTGNLQPTFSSIQANIFDGGDSSGRPPCTSCHNAQLAQFNGGLNLSGGAAYGNLVGARSTGNPAMTRVVPGDPNNSYLVHKLQGRPGIVGLRMPISGPYLTDGQIAVIERWIDAGAAND